MGGDSSLWWMGDSSRRMGGRQFSMVDGRQFPAVLSRDQNGAVRRHAEVLNREHLEPIGVHPRTVGFRPRTVYRYGGGKVALLESGLYVGPYGGRQFSMVDAPTFDLRTAPPFQGLVNPEDQRPVALIHILEQQHQQYAARRMRRPHRPVEHLISTLRKI